MLEGVGHRLEADAELGLPDREVGLRQRRVRQCQRRERRQHQHRPARRLDVQEARERLDDAVDRLAGKSGFRVVCRVGHGRRMIRGLRSRFTAPRGRGTRPAPVLKRLEAPRSSRLPRLRRRQGSRRTAPDRACGRVRRGVSPPRRRCRSCATTAPRECRRTPPSPCLVAQLPLRPRVSSGHSDHYPIISPSSIPSVVMVFRILHPILASTRCDASPLARIAGPTMVL